MSSHHVIFVEWTSARTNIVTLDIMCCYHSLLIVTCNLHGFTTQCLWLSVMSRPSAKFTIDLSSTAWSKLVTRLIKMKSKLVICSPSQWCKIENMFIVQYLGMYNFGGIFVLCTLQHTCITIHKNTGKYQIVLRVNWTSTY